MNSYFYQLSSLVLYTTVIWMLLTEVNSQPVTEIFVDGNVIQSGIGTQSSPYKTIEEAFQSLSTFSTAVIPPTQVTINIASSTYTPVSRLSMLNLPFDVTLNGNDAATCIIECSLDNTGHLILSSATPGRKNAIRKITFTGCLSSSNSPITIDQYAELTMEEVFVTNNKLSDAVLARGNSKLTLNKVKLLNNSPMSMRQCNGLYMLDNSTGLVDDLEIGSTTTSVHGTGIIINTSGQFTGNKVYIYNARVGGSSNGGAVSVTNGTAKFTNSRFIGNYAGNGGAISISGTGVVEVLDSEFKGQQATNGGNIYATQTGMFTCVNCHMSESKGSISAYFWLRQYTTTTLNNVTVQGNYTQASTSGASVFFLADFAKLKAEDMKIDAVFGSSTTIHIQNSVVANFTRLQASNTRNFNWGGLFRLETPNPTLNIHDSYIYNITHTTACVFTHQGGIITVQNTTINGAFTVPGGGGALVQSISADATIIFRDCNLMNLVTNTWAVVLVAGGTIIFENCSIQHVTNTINGASFVYLAFGQVIFRNSSITDSGYSPLYGANYNGKDGLMFVDSGGSLLMENTLVARNNASSNFGVLFTGTYATVHIYNVTTTDNISGEGTVINLADNFQGTFNMTNSAVTNNIVSNRGGGLFFNKLNPSAKITLKNINFKNNTAKYGGAIYSGSQDFLINCENCSFESNRATSGGGAIFTRFYSGRIQTTGQSQFIRNEARYGDDQATEPVKFVTSGLYDGTSLSLHSGDVLKNFSVKLVDYYGQQFRAIYEENIPVSDIIVDKFSISGNSSLSGDVSVLCWDGSCDNVQLKILGYPGNHTLTLKALASAGFKELENFKLSIPVIISDCPITDDKHVILQSAADAFPVCIIPFCPGCVNGKCIADNTCECYKTWRGNDCTLRYPYEENGAIKLVFTILAIVSMVFSVSLGLLFIWKRNAPVIRKASAKFMVLMCFGSAVCYATILIGKSTSELCLGQLWLKYIGFCMIFGSILVKSYRIHIIFKSTRKVAVTDNKLLAICAGLTSIFIAFLIIWSVADFPYINNDGISSSNTSYNYCVPPRSNAIGLVIQILYYAGGIFLAISTRNVSAEYNEAKTTGASIYFWAFIDVLIQVLLLVVRFNPDAAYILESVGMLLINWFAVGFVLVPKIFNLWKSERPSSAVGSAATSSKGTSSVTQAYNKVPNIP